MRDITDSHCHLDFPEFDANRAELIARCEAAGITHFIVPGVTAETWPRLVQLRADFPNIRIAFGLHPYFIEQHKERDVDQLQTFCQQHNPVAIGEIGLDFYRKDLPRENQITFFQKQLALAEQLQLPVILHVRKAHQDVITLLKQYKLPGGMAHAFNGSYEQALQYIALGFKLGFGGALINPNANKLRKLTQQLPLEAIVLETDSPDMKPVDSDEQYNTPLTLLRVLNALSEIRKQSTDILIEQIANNVMPYIR